MTKSDIVDIKCQTFQIIENLNSIRSDTRQHSKLSKKKKQFLQDKFPVARSFQFLRMEWPIKSSPLCIKVKRRMTGTFLMDFPSTHHPASSSICGICLQLSLLILQLSSTIKWIFHPSSSDDIFSSFPCFVF